MEINKNLSYDRHVLPESSVLLFDNFLKTPLDLSEKKFESNTQIEKFPVGLREKEKVDVSILYPIIEKEYNVKVSSVEAEYIFSGWTDVADYKSDYFKQFSSVDPENKSGAITLGDMAETLPKVYDEDGNERSDPAFPGGDFALSDFTGEDEKPYIEYDLIKKESLQILPSRPVWDTKKRYHAILFLADYNLLQKNLHEDKKIEFPFPLNFWRHKFAPLTSSYAWDNSYYENQWWKCFIYNIEVRHNKEYLSDIRNIEEIDKDLEIDQPPVLDDNFHISHTTCDFNSMLSIPNEYNQLVIFPGWYYHSFIYHHLCQLPQLYLHMVFE